MEHLSSHLAEEISRRADGKEIFVVGISGPDTSGKSTLAKNMADQLRAPLFSVDWFHFPRAIRRASPGTPAEQFVHHSIDFDRLIREVLRPVRAGVASITFEYFDVDADRGQQVAIDIPQPGIVVVEGIFLLQPKILPFLNFTVLLNVSEEEILQRARIRDATRYAAECDDVAKRYREKYLPGQALYRQLHSPEEVADMIIDNSDWDNPVILKPAHA